MAALSVERSTSPSVVGVSARAAVTDASAPAGLAGGTGVDVQPRVNRKISKDSVMRIFFTNEPPNYEINGAFMQSHAVQNNTLRNFKNIPDLS